MKTPLLRDPTVYPDAAVLERESGESYAALCAFLDTVESKPYQFVPEWRYYRDGSAWLCKLTAKKKTVAWLSIWPGCFKVAFYFTAQSGAGIAKLKIPDATKERYRTHEPVGKLKPLVFEVSQNDQLDEVYRLLRYKAGLK